MDEVAVPHYIGFWSRFVAFIIDGIFLGIIEAILHSNSSVNTLLSFAYFIGMTYTYGATLGKKALNMKVVDADGNKPSIEKIIIRETVGKFISAIVIGVGYVWIAFDVKKQAWHDKIAGTYVVQA